MSDIATPISASNFWQPTDPNIFEYFNDKLGLKAWENGTPEEATLDLEEGEFLCFLKNLGEAKKNELLDILRKYDGCMAAIKEGVFPYAAALQTTALMATIELAMGNKPYIRLDEYLLNKLKCLQTVSGDQAQEWISSYHEEYGQRNSIKQFFSENLTGVEKQQLLDYLKTCPEWDCCISIEKFVDQLLGYRHKFVHELSRNSLWPFPQRLKLAQEGAGHSISPTVAPSQLIGLIWKGVLRKFGYLGRM